VHGEIGVIYLAALCKKIVRKPLIATITRNFSSYPLLSLNCNESRGPSLFSYFKSRVASTLNHLICQNYYTKKQLIHAGVPPRKISVIPYGIKKEFLCSDKLANLDYGNNMSHLREKKGDKLILFWGNLGARSAIYTRGLNIFLSSINKILEKIPKSYFLAAVNFDGNAELENFCFRLFKGIKRFKVLNEQNGWHSDSLPDIARSADVITLPFVRNAMEPPLTILESMAMGKAVVTTNIGGNDEIINNYQNGILIEPSSSQLVKAVIYLLSDDKRREIIGKRAQQYVMEHCNWDRCLEKVTAVYERLVRN